MQIPRDICVLVADHGVGDHYIVAGFAETIRRQFGVRVWMAGRDDLPFMTRLFPAVERYLHWPAKSSRAGLKETRIRGGALFDAHFPGLELMRAVGYRDFHFLDAYRCRFGLPPDAPLSQPARPSEDELREAQAALEAAGIPVGRFVLLCPDARSTPTDGVTPGFWQGVAQGLRAAGLTPVVNTGPGAKAPEGMEDFSAPLQWLRSVAMLSAGVCTVRSGLSDLFCDLPCAQAVVYPEVRYWAGPLRHGTNFQRFGLEHPPHELTVTPASAAQSAREIVALFADAPAPAVLVG
jgi:hypothetical protein